MEANLYIRIVNLHLAPANPKDDFTCLNRRLPNPNLNPTYIIPPIVANVTFHGLTQIKSHAMNTAHNCEQWIITSEI